jgi:hypothetical protein
VFAEACDGFRPRALVDALVAEDGGPGWTTAAGVLADWLRAARDVEAADIDPEVQPWIERVRQEAQLMLAALRVYQDTKPVARIDASGRGHVAASSEDEAFRHAGALALQWKAMRRATPEVMGPRLGLKVAFGQASSGGFAYRPGVVEEDACASDALVRHALAQAEELGAPGDVAVLADGADVAIDGAGAFEVPADTVVVMLRSGAAATRVSVPCEPPLPERRLDV